MSKSSKINKLYSKKPYDSSREIKESFESKNCFVQSPKGQSTPNVQKSNYSFYRLLIEISTRLLIIAVVLQALITWRNFQEEIWIRRYGIVFALLTWVIYYPIKDYKYFNRRNHHE